MRPINLAESKIAERTYCRQHLNHRMRVIALLGVLVACVAAGSFACKMTVRGKESAVKSQLADEQGRCAGIKREITKLSAKLSERKWHEKLAGGSKYWLGTLGFVLSCVPDDIWLGRVESVQKDSMLVVEGNTLSFASLSDFIDRLKAGSRFSDVRLCGTKTSGAKAGICINFSLTLKLKAGAPGAAPPASSPTPEQPGQVPAVQEST